MTPNYYVGGTYENEIDFLKTWIHERLLWIDENIPLINSYSAVEILTNSVPEFAIYPNPAQESTNFKIENAGPGDLVIQVFSPTGQMIDEIAYYLGYPGIWIIPFSIRSRIGSTAAGIYSCRLFIDQVLIITKRNKAFRPSFWWIPGFINTAPIKELDIFAIFRYGL